MENILNIASIKKNKVTKELIKGKKVTTQLQELMKKPSWESDENKHLGLELVKKILGSYDQSLLVLESDDDDEVFHQGMMTNSRHAFDGFDEGVTEESSESKKRPAPTMKDKRGCYKRKKSSDTWTMISSNSEDQYAWRKYGQKAILNHKHARNYYRCTHKYDQGCKAIKQVQKMEENPELLHITYIGVHTCKEIMKAPQMISDSYDQKHLEPMLVFSLTSSEPQEQQQQHFINPFPTTTNSSTTLIKEEGREESGLTDNNNVSSMDSYMPNELMSTESAEPTALSSEDMGFDEYGISDLYPRSTSQGFEDLIENYFDF